MDSVVGALLLHSQPDSVFAIGGYLFVHNGFVIDRFSFFFFRRGFFCFAEHRGHIRNNDVIVKETHGIPPFHNSHKWLMMAAALAPVFRSLAVVEMK